jgi:hypothetical protein
VRFVLAGDEVYPESLNDLVSRALTLAFARFEKQLVGVGAIKRPNPSYHTETFAKAGMKHTTPKYKFELGWIFVHRSSRRCGVANALVEKLVLSLNGTPVYATSRLDNEGIHIILKRYSFYPLGIPYSSQRNDSMIQLFVHD